MSSAADVSSAVGSASAHLPVSRSSHWIWSQDPSIDRCRVMKHDEATSAVPADGGAALRLSLRD